MRKSLNGRIPFPLDVRFGSITSIHGCCWFGCFTLTCRRDPYAAGTEASCHEPTFRHRKSSTGCATRARVPRRLGRRNDEGLNPPGFFPERLKERNARRLEFEEQLLDLIMRLDAHIGGQQALFVSECGSITV
jgi:hypothetical protein